MALLLTIGLMKVRPPPDPPPPGSPCTLALASPPPAAAVALVRRDLRDAQRRDRPSAGRLRLRPAQLQGPEGAPSPPLRARVRNRVRVSEPLTHPPPPPKPTPTPTPYPGLLRGRDHALPRRHARFLRPGHAISTLRDGLPLRAALDGSLGALPTGRRPACGPRACAVRAECCGRDG